MELAAIHKHHGDMRLPCIGLTHINHTNHTHTHTEKFILSELSVKMSTTVYIQWICFPNHDRLFTHMCAHAIRSALSFIQYFSKSRHFLSNASVENPG